MTTEERLCWLETKNRRLERLLAASVLAVVALGSIAAASHFENLVAGRVEVKDASGATKITLSPDGNAMIAGSLFVRNTDVIRRLDALEENWKHSHDLSSIKVYTQKDIVFGSMVGSPTLKLNDGTPIFCAPTTSAEIIDLNAPELRLSRFSGPLLQSFGKKVVFCYMYPESAGGEAFQVAEALAEGNRVKFRLQGNPGRPPTAVNFRVVVGYIPNE